MIDILTKLITLLYASIGVIGTVAYWPTIRDLYYKKKQSANITSYILWNYTAIVAFLYGLFVLKDLLYQIIAGIGFLYCAIILGLSIRLKYKRMNQRHTITKFRNIRKNVKIGRGPPVKCQNCVAILSTLRNLRFLMDRLACSLALTPAVF